MDNRPGELETFEDRAVVRSVSKGMVEIEILQSGSCDSCGMSGFCGGKDKSFRHTVRTDMKLTPGDIVEVHMSPGVRFLSSILLFLIPVLSLMGFYAIARYAIGLGEDLSIMIGLGSLLLCGILIRWFDKRYANKIHMEIVDKVEGS